MNFPVAVTFLVVEQGKQTAGNEENGVKCFINKRLLQIKLLAPMAK